MRLLLSVTIIGIALVSIPVAASSSSSTGSVDQKSMRLSRRKLYSSLSKRGHGHGKKKKKHGGKEEAKKKDEKSKNDAEGGKSGSLIPSNQLELPPLQLPNLPALPALPAIPTIPTLSGLFGSTSS